MAQLRRDPRTATAYDVVHFKNEVLGLPTSMGELILTRPEMEACCTDKPMASSIADIPAMHRGNVIAGVDWGGGAASRTVVVVGYMRPDAKFVIRYLTRIRADEHPESVRRQVAEVCRRFRVRWIGADGGGNGHVYNRLLLDTLHQQVGLYAILYSAGGSRAATRRDPLEVDRREIGIDRLPHQPASRTRRLSFHALRSAALFSMSSAAKWRSMTIRTGA